MMQIRSKEQAGRPFLLFYLNHWIRKIMDDMIEAEPVSLASIYAMRLYSTPILPM